MQIGASDMPIFPRYTGKISAQPQAAEPQQKTESAGEGARWRRRRRKFFQSTPLGFISLQNRPTMICTTEPGSYLQTFQTARYK